MDTETDAAAIEFGTDGWRATLDEFTEPRVRMVGQAVAAYLRDEGATVSGPDRATVVVGYDAREHSRGFAEELARVLCANGFDVLLPERDLPTPVTAWTVAERGLAGGLVLTASHNPPEYNGVKFIPDGSPATSDVTDAIADRLAEPDPRPEAEWGSVTETDLVDPFLERALDAVDADLSGRRVVYDAMHGSGRGVTDALLERAGADVERLRCERDADFGGGAPEPVAERLETLADRVAERGATLGVANDGDADRITVVTPERGVLDPNLFFAATYDALLSGDVDTDLATGTSGDVVRTVSTSSIVDRVAEDHGEAVHETAVGFKWVAAAMAEHDALMGGEESGGFGLSRHLRNKDGVLVALLAAAVAADESYDERVDRLLDDHGAIHQSRVSVNCPDERKEPVLDELESALPDAVAGVAVDDVNTVDGFKIALEDGTWLLVRPSGTEPKMRIYAEAGSTDRVDELLDAGRDIVDPLV
ncbi:MAG: phosphoglucomutase/phosphomannomutase family protein [Haloarculaceae archaeon]